MENDRDIAAELAAIAAQQEREHRQKQAMAGARAALVALEARARACGEAETRLGAVEQRRATLEAQLDPALREDALRERSGAIRKGALEEADAIHRDLLAEVEQARLEAAAFDPSRLRRRATFAPEAVADAAIRSTWLQRLARMPASALAEWADHATSLGDVPLAGMIEEELAARPDGVTAAERDALATAKAAVHRLVPDEVRRAEAAREAIERAERAVAERIRLMRGGRPSGLHSIAEGLRERRAG